MNFKVKDPDDLPFPLLDLNIKYQAYIEKNKNGITEEIVEYYDGEKNIAAMSTVVGGKRIFTYLNPSKNELIYVMGIIFFSH